MRAPRARSTSLLELGLALALATLAAACGREPALPPGATCSALLVTLDTTRLDALSIHGREQGTTPALDRLAQESVRYAWCRTVAPVTLPAHASMMTGLYPPRHGVRDNGAGALPSAAVTVAERAAEAGIDTAAFVAAAVLDRELGLDQGFEHYDQPARPGERRTVHYVERPADEVLDAALAWLRARDGDRRFLAWVHLFDPHAPWGPSPEDAGERAAYLGDVRAMDRELGRFLEALRADGLLAHTAVVVVADHGEDLRDHGEPNHAAYVYDTTLRVPLLVRHPDGHRAGEVSDEVVSVVDVGPTLCAALGLEPLADVDGTSLWRARAPAGRGVYFESYVGYLNYGWAPLVGWADAGGKLIHGGRSELYDPASDPAEREDLAGLVDASDYRAHVEAVHARPALEPDGGPASGALLDDLAALGYAAAAPRATDLPPPFEDTGRPAPADRLQEYLDFLAVGGLMEAGELRAAVRLLDGIVLENPGHVAALDRLGLCFVLVQGWPEAIEILEQRLEQAEGPVSTHVNLALAYEQTGRLEEARVQLERALELGPASATARAALERVRARLAGDRAPAAPEDG